jgi:serine phosphatase RsbU (regulator of sigma subunit)
VVVRDELEVARQLQRELLPERAPEVPGYRFSFSYSTANTIGGDYYDFLTLDDGRLVLLMGDASGHGIAAGLVMAVASSTLGLAFDDGDDPAAAALLVNRALCRVGTRRSFMTLFCGVLEPTTGRLRLVTAGHPYPLLRSADQTISELGSGSLPLGIRRDLQLEVHESVVGRGDLLLLSTDGVVETLDPSGASYGFDRLRDILAAGGSCREVHDRVLEDVDSFRGDEPIHDDRSLVVIERLGA